jgi:hypothetical protein
VGEVTKKKTPLKGINPALTRAINKLIDEVMREEKPAELKEGERAPEPKYSLTDKMKVLDRALKHEAIRLKVEDDGEGGFFKTKGAENGDT